MANVEYHGRYRSPEDLSRIYGNLHVVWAGDFMEVGFNSAWLLPNRLYEGGYYGVPAIAPAHTQTASWIEARQAGFTIDEDLARTLPDLLRTLMASPGLIADRRTRLLDLADETFVAQRGELAGLIQDSLASPASPRGTPSPAFSPRDVRNPAR